MVPTEYDRGLGPDGKIADVVRLDEGPTKGKTPARILGVDDAYRRSVMPFFQNKTHYHIAPDMDLRSVLSGDPVTPKPTPRFPTSVK